MLVILPLTNTFKTSQKTNNLLNNHFSKIDFILYTNQLITSNPVKDSV